MDIRTATPADLEALAALEAACFPPAEAAAPQALAGRLLHYPDHFWLLLEGKELLSFVDGFVTDRRDLTDDMYDVPSLHDPKGAWQMIFGVNTHPAHRGRGYAGLLLRRAISDAKTQGRKGLVLTCKEPLLPFYAKLGFQDEGLSASVHGNVSWRQMRLTFQ